MKTLFYLGDCNPNVKICGRANAVVLIPVGNFPTLPPIGSIIDPHIFITNIDDGDSVRFPYPDNYYYEVSNWLAEGVWFEVKEIWFEEIGDDEEIVTSVKCIKSE